MKFRIDIWKASGRLSVLLGLLLTLNNGCSGKSPGATAVRPTNFASGVNKADADTEEEESAKADALAAEDAAAADKAERLKKQAELAQDTALFNLETAKDKMATLQSKLTNAESRKDSLGDRINSIDTELASIVVPSGRSVQAAVAYYNGDYATAYAAQAQATAAKNAALKKKENLTNLRTTVEGELNTANQVAADLEAQIEALEKEIYEATGKAYGQL